MIIVLCKLDINTCEVDKLMFRGDTIMSEYYTIQDIALKTGLR